jgi:hypothetical protein
MMQSVLVRKSFWVIKKGSKSENFEKNYSIYSEYVTLGLKCTLLPRRKNSKKIFLQLLYWVEFILKLGKRRPAAAFIVAGCYNVFVGLDG